MPDNLAIIRTYSQTLSDEDLAAAWRILYDEYNRRRDENFSNLKKNLKVGDHVSWHGRNGEVLGKVVKIKYKKCIVHQIVNGRANKKYSWDVPIKMMRKVKKS